MKIITNTIFTLLIIIALFFLIPPMEFIITLAIKDWARILGF